MPNFYLGLLASCFGPLLLLFVVVVILYLRKRMYGLRSLPREELACSICVILWLLQADVAHSVFAAFSCKLIDGKLLLMSDLTVECWTGPH